MFVLVYLQGEYDQLLRKKIFCLLLCMFCAFSACSCADTEMQNVHTKEMYALDTIITITAYGDKAPNAIEAAEREILRLEKLFSVTDAESDISRINSADGGTVTVSEETAELILRSKEISSGCFGAFDISIYPLVSLWGFTKNEYSVPNSADLQSALKLVDFSKIDVKGTAVTLPRGMSIDLGGVAKGYISEKTADVLKENGVESAVISLGGNIYTVGIRADKKEWAIGLKNPDGEGNLAVINCEETAIITSGGYQRYFTENGKKYHHILSPSSGCPAESGIKSSTVISTDSTLADALSTAFYVLGAEKSVQLAEKFGVDFVFVTDDGKVLLSDGIADRFTLLDDSYEIG